MKYAVKRNGFLPAHVRQIAGQNDQMFSVVLCLANESCAIGDEPHVTLRNYLIRNYKKYAKIYGGAVCLRTGEVFTCSPLNHRYVNRRSYHVCDLKVRREILVQLKKRLWWYLEETKIKLWITGLADEKPRS
jgi:hypothetical protein